MKRAIYLSQVWPTFCRTVAHQAENGTLFDGPVLIGSNHDEAEIFVRS